LDSLPVVLTFGIGIVMTLFAPKSRLDVLFYIAAGLLAVVFVVLPLMLPERKRNASIFSRLQHDRQFAKRYALTAEWIPQRDIDPDAIDDFDDIDEKSKLKHKPKR
jgi:ABC-type anion transport system duplicated permease subunit